MELDHSNSPRSGPNICFLYTYSDINECFTNNIQILMSVSVTREVATTTAMTQMEVTHVPAMMATNLTVMDVLVKVGKVDEYKSNKMQVLLTIVGYEVPKNIL